MYDLICRDGNAVQANKYIEVYVRIQSNSDRDGTKSRRFLEQVRQLEGSRSREGSIVTR